MKNMHKPVSNTHSILSVKMCKNANVKSPIWNILCNFDLLWAKLPSQFILLTNAPIVERHYIKTQIITKLNEIYCGRDNRQLENKRGTHFAKHWDISYAFLWLIQGFKQPKILNDVLQGTTSRAATLIVLFLEPSYLTDVFLNPFYTKTAKSEPATTKLTPIQTRHKGEGQ